MLCKIYVRWGYLEKGRGETGPGAGGCVPLAEDEECSSSASSSAIGSCFARAINASTKFSASPAVPSTSLRILWVGGRIFFFQHFTTRCFNINIKRV